MTYLSATSCRNYSNCLLKTSTYVLAVFHIFGERKLKSCESLMFTQCFPIVPMEPLLFSGSILNFLPWLSLYCVYLGLGLLVSFMHVLWSLFLSFPESILWVLWDCLCNLNYVLCLCMPYMFFEFIIFHNSVILWRGQSNKQSSRWESISILACTGFPFKAFNFYSIWNLSPLKIMLCSVAQWTFFCFF